MKRTGKRLAKWWLGVAAWAAVVGPGGAAEPPAAPRAIPLPATTIKHRFLAVDDSRMQLVHVAQQDPSRNWALKLPPHSRDCQLIGGGRLLVTTGDGYREYNLATRQVLRDRKGFSEVMFARRRADGTTVLGQNGKTWAEILELDASDQVVRTARFDKGRTLLGRLTPQGTVLFGAYHRLLEGTLDGRLLQDLPLQGCRGLYQALRRSDGHLLVAEGYACDLVELDAAGKVLKRLGGKDTPEAGALGYHFFGGFQVLNNGHVVLANWTGHGSQDSAKGAQLLEFNPQGRVVWAWHDPGMAGSVSTVIVLDDLDPEVLNDDINGVIETVSNPRKP